MCDVDIKLNGERVDCGTSLEADARGAAGGGEGIGRGRMGAKGGSQGRRALRPARQGPAEADSTQFKREMIGLRLEDNL